MTVATQQIEYLRKQLARATDQIGTNTQESIAAGRAIYRQIFTPDVKISASNGVDSELFVAHGSDA